MKQYPKPLRTKQGQVILDAEYYDTLVRLLDGLYKDAHLAHVSALQIHELVQSATLNEEG